MAVDWELEIERRGDEARITIVLEDGNEISVNPQRRTVSYTNSAPRCVTNVNRSTETDINPDPRITRY